MFIQFNPQENERVEAMEEPHNENVSKHNETSEDKLNKQKTEIAANKLARYRDVSNIRHWLFMAIKWIISVFWLCLIKPRKSIIDMESLYSSLISFHNTLLSVACSILFEQWVR